MKRGHTPAAVSVTPKKAGKPIKYNSVRFRWLKFKMTLRLFWYNNVYRAAGMLTLAYMLFVGRVKIVGVRGYKAGNIFVKGYVFSRKPATLDPRQYNHFPF